ncbi:LytTR family DNA-binding domain-containing protein [Roseibium sp. SCP14]|uniref:LytTR family DNA-binding domain-containing protein n=1 Tax=Roseibium sp. SCP14 TaxID=3141375 RepID=UPI00333947CC
MMTSDPSSAGPHWLAVVKNVALTALVGTCIAMVLEPDHTAGLPVLVAFGLWFTHFFFAAGLYLASVRLAMKAGLTELRALIVSVPLLPILFAPFSLFLDYGFGNPDEAALTLSGFPMLYLDEVVAIAPLMLLLAVIVAYLFRKDQSQQLEPAMSEQDVSPQPVEPSPPKLSDLIEGVSADLGEDLIRMAAQDHYVEIVTNQGRALVTEKFSDCVAKLEHFNGMQCHRSHWISLAHVQNVERSGSAYSCLMTNGDRIPVSRRRWTDLKKQRAVDRISASPASLTTNAAPIR